MASQSDQTTAELLGESLVLQPAGRGAQPIGDLSFVGMVVVFPETFR